MRLILILTMCFLPVLLHAEANSNLRIRTLAASCAACHGTNGNAQGGNAVLAGIEAQHIIGQLEAFKSGTHASTVMHRHAKGLTSDEINALAIYFAAQKPAAGTALKPQPLAHGHE